jgi:predicted AlkP superfamily pyrophosphatase or phosphodiesterase
MDCVIIFFLDAVRFDYLNSRDTPFLYKVATSGISGPLKTIWGFSGIAATIFCGAHPKKHGVWTQYTSSQSSIFKWLEPFSPILDRVDHRIENHKMKKGFRLALLQSSRFLYRMSYYPGVHEVPFKLLPKLDFSMKKNLYEPNAFIHIPSLFDILRQKEINFSIMDYPLMGFDYGVVRKILRMRKFQKIIYVRLMDLDETTHKFGVYSRERILKLRETDKYVEIITKHIERMGMNPITVIFADHGFLDVTNSVDIIETVRKTGLKEGKDFIVFLDSTMARFWGNSSALNKIHMILSDMKVGRFFTKSDLDEYNLPTSTNYGNLIYVVNPGILISPNYYQGYSKVKSMHGYDPNIPEQKTIFMLSSSGYFSKLEELNLVDILPTILKLLEIPKPESCVGKSLL